MIRPPTPPPRPAQLHLTPGCLGVYAYPPARAGLPEAPWFCTLADRLLVWLGDGSLPVDLVPMPGYMEVVEGRALLTSSAPVVLPLVARLHAQAVEATGSSSSSSGGGGSEAEGDAWVAAMDVSGTVRAWAGVLAALGAVGVSYLLGFRRTVGSVERLPPPRPHLMPAFLTAFDPQTRLSVGARALCKHCHRASGPDSFWPPNMNGTVDVRNGKALDVLRRMCAGTTWMNCHMLPHDELVFELRVPEGFGCRWSLDGALFRGFLEPHMPDGHEKGWRH